MGETVAVANQKGGVGKTTTVVSLAAFLARDGYRILIADIDPQGNATSGLGIDRSALDASVYDVLLGDVAAADVIRETGIGGLDLLPSDRSLAGAEVELVPRQGRERRLAPGAGARRWPIRLHPPRLPAVARPPHGQRAHRG